MWKPSDAFPDVGRDKHVRALPGAQPQAPAARPDPPETHNLEAFWSLSWRLAGGGHCRPVSQTRRGPDFGPQPGVEFWPQNVPQRRIYLEKLTKHSPGSPRLAPERGSETDPWITPVCVPLWLCAEAPFLSTQRAFCRRAETSSRPATATPPKRHPTNVASARPTSRSRSLSGSSCTASLARGALPTAAHHIFGEFLTRGREAQVVSHIDR